MTKAEYMRRWRAANPGYEDKRDWEARKEYMRLYMRKYRGKEAPPVKSVPSIVERPGWPTRAQLMSGRAGR